MIYTNSINFLERLNLANFKANKPKMSTIAGYQADLPPIETQFVVIVEIINQENNRKKIIACEDEEKADNLVKLFNLVSCFTYYNEAIAE